MSRSSITLKADNLKVVCAANRRYAVAIPNPVKGKLQVTKRTDSVSAITAELRKLKRDFPTYPAYVFDLPTGVMVLKLWQTDEPPKDDSLVARAISDALGRS